MGRRAPKGHGTYVDDRTGRRRRLPAVPPLDFERPLWDDGQVVVGVDEVGRGAWAGPVTCAAVALDPDRRIYKLRDSKVIDQPARERLSGRIHEHAAAVAVGHATNDEIDRWGMTKALRVAAGRAVDGLHVSVDAILLDGNFDFLAQHPAAVTTIIKGDARSASVAAASIVAKVARDRLMAALEADQVVYGFAGNKGYPAPDHVTALDEHGPCRWHRHSWEPIVKRTMPRLFD